MKTVFFDLDGTLTDAGWGIRSGTAYALTALGRKTTWQEVTPLVVGPTLYDSFTGIFGLPHEEAEQAVRLYRRYYGEQGWKENHIYDGVLEMLASLKGDGYSICIATGKPWTFSEKICHAFGISPYLTRLFGTEFDGTFGNKRDLLAHAMRELGVLPEEALMVGDRRYDMLGALENGICPIGVLYGYGSREELLAAGGEGAALAASPGEVTALVRTLLPL